MLLLLLLLLLLSSLVSPFSSFSQRNEISFPFSHLVSKKKNIELEQTTILL